MLHISLEEVTWVRHEYMSISGSKCWRGKEVARFLTWSSFAIVHRRLAQISANWGSLSVPITCCFYPHWLECSLWKILLFRHQKHLEHPNWMFGAGWGQLSGRGTAVMSLVVPGIRNGLFETDATCATPRLCTPYYKGNKADDQKFPRSPFSVIWQAYPSDQLDRHVFCP